MGLRAIAYIDPFTKNQTTVPKAVEQEEQALK
jgi:hypothetical protein